MSSDYIPTGMARTAEGHFYMLDIGSPPPPPPPSTTSFPPGPPVTDPPIPPATGPPRLFNAPVAASKPIAAQRNLDQVFRSWPASSDREVYIFQEFKTDYFNADGEEVEAPHVELAPNKVRGKDELTDLEALEVCYAKFLKQNCLNSFLSCPKILFHVCQLTHPKHMKLINLGTEILQMANRRHPR